MLIRSSFSRWTAITERALPASSRWRGVVMSRITRLVESITSMAG